MKNWFLKIKIPSSITTFLCLTLGVILLINIDISKHTVTILLGSLILLYGVVAIINYFIYGYESFGLTAGLMYIILAIFILCCSKILTTYKVFAFMCGFILLIRSMFRIPNLIDYFKNQIKHWWMEIVFSIILLSLSIVCIYNPFSTLNGLTSLLGVGLIIDSLFKIIISLYTCNKVKRNKHSIKEIFLIEKDKN